MTDWYDVLQVSPDAEPTVIHSAYRALVKQYHPDKFHGDTTQAEARMKLINAAYTVLGDDTQRRRYDSSRNRTSVTDKKPLLKRLGLPWWVWMLIWGLVMPKVLGWMMISPVGKIVLMILTAVMFWRLMPQRPQQ
ncbi:MAG: J domain-containing protein [Vampirovibrionales bacterium]|nr:J domain-containing protein [Vampirovibrionales bacterium]